MTDPRAAAEYRIPAASLKAGDLVNLAPGDDDWQEVLAVHTSAASASDPATKTFLATLEGKYVYVEVTSLEPVDSTIYVDENGVGRTNEDDSSVEDAIGDSTGVRIYLFTKYELVTVRS